MASTAIATPLLVAWSPPTLTARESVAPPWPPPHPPSRVPSSRAACAALGERAAYGADEALKGALFCFTCAPQPVRATHAANRGWSDHPRNGTTTAGTPAAAHAAVVPEPPWWMTHPHLGNRNACGTLAIQYACGHSRTVCGTSAPTATMRRPQLRRAPSRSAAHGSE